MPIVSSTYTRTPCPSCPPSEIAKPAPKRTAYTGRALCAVPALGLAVFGLTLTSCSGNVQPGPAAIASHMVRNTESASSVLDDVSVDIESSSGSMTPAGQARGGFDFSTGAGWASMTGLGLSPGDKSMILFTTREIYMRVPPGYRINYPGVKSWLDLWYGDLNAISTAQAGFAVTAEMLNPDYLLMETADGVQHLSRSRSSDSMILYTGSINLNAVASTAGGTRSDLVNQEIDYIGESHLPITLWTNAGRITKLAIVLVPSSGSSTSHLAAGTTITMSLSGFGKHVQVNVPPVQDTSNLDTVLENASGGEMGEPPGEPPGQ